MTRSETFGIAHVVWFVSAVYFLAGATLAYWTALAGFGLLALGFSYEPFRASVMQSVRRRTRR